MAIRFANRQQAGELLATKLTAYADRPHVLVLALPRGGVPVGFALAHPSCLARCLPRPQTRHAWARGTRHGGDCVWRGAGTEH